MTKRVWKKTGLTAQPFYKKLCEDERRYEAASKCEGPFCGLTTLVLSVILLAPLVVFCIDCILKAH